MGVIDMEKYRKVKRQDGDRGHASNGDSKVSFCELGDEEQRCRWAQAKENRLRKRAKENLLRAAAKLDW